MAVHCEDLNLLYLCTAKTGSTSVSDALLQQLGGRWLPADHIWDGDQIAVDFKHSSLHDLVEYDLLTDSDIRAMHIAITVRNPFAWVLSGYRYRRSVMRQIEELGPSTPAWILSRRDDIERAMVDFDDYVAVECDSRERSIAARYLDGFFDHPSITYLRIESIDSDFNRLLTPLGVGWQINFPHVNTTSGPDYRSTYSQTSRAAVERAFAADLRAFDYEF